MRAKTQFFYIIIHSSAYYWLKELIFFELNPKPAETKKSINKYLTTFIYFDKRKKLKNKAYDKMK